MPPRFRQGFTLIENVPFPALNRSEQVVFHLLRAAGKNDRRKRFSLISWAFCDRIDSFFANALSIGGIRKNHLEALPQLKLVGD